jgi:hypothetical protein
MKIQKKQILMNVATLGYSGYKRAKEIFEENSLRERVLLSDQILGFMLVLPIMMAVTIAFGLIESFARLNDFFSELNESLEMESIGTNLFETISFIPTCFMLFCLLHLFLGLALLQHTSGLKAGERAYVLWFGLYALDWTPSDYLKPLDS